MEDVLVKLNPGLPWQKLHSTGRRHFYQQIGLKFEEETSKKLHLEHGFVWCWNCRICRCKFVPLRLRRFQISACRTVFTEGFFSISPGQWYSTPFCITT